jgi:hypothetical protein
MIDGTPKDYYYYWNKFKNVNGIPKYQILVLQFLLHVGE